MFKLLFSMTVTILKVTTIFLLNQFSSSSIFYSIIYYHARNYWIVLLQEIFKIIFELQISAFIDKFKTF